MLERPAPIRALAAAWLILAAAPLAAHPAGCSRGADGALRCGRPPQPGTSSGLRPVRIAPDRDLAADALARGNAQAEAMKDARDRQRAGTDRQRAEQRRLECFARAETEGMPPRACGL